MVATAVCLEELNVSFAMKELESRHESLLKAFEGPMHELRKLPVEDRIAWLESNTDEEVVALYEQHNKCLECKLEDRAT